MKRLCLAAFCLLLAAEGRPESHVQLILDASGSMYNKLEDGRYRIVAAKEVLRSFVDGLPDDGLNVGLRIYGSERGPKDQGSCQDSKLFVPMAGFDRPALLDTIRDTRAKGSTPIAYSLGQAAADFPEGAGQCVIVLVTDGEEVCGGDLKASAAMLRERGCQIDLRIIGFDLTPEAVASFEGVGTFENATDAAGLGAALDRAVEDVVERTPLGEARLEAAAEVPAGSGFPVEWAAEEGDRDYVTIVAKGAKDGSYGSYAYTRSGNPVTLHAPVKTGEYELRYQSDRVSGVSGRRPIRVVEAELALEAPTEIPAGQPFEVSWVGPNGDRDYLTIVAKNAKDGAFGSYRYTREGSPLTLRASIQDGDFEIRYQSDRVKGVFGRRPVTVLPAEIVLDAPADVAAGSPFEVQWQGPNGERDYLTVVAAGAPDGTYTNYAYTRSGPVVKLHAPVKAGAVEVRYQSDREKGVFARLVINVTPLDVELQAPSTVGAGEKFQVTWRGPNGQQDYITIVPKGANAGAYTHYQYTRSGSPVTLTAPDEAGAYEVRYQSDREKSVIFGSRLIQVR